MPRRRHFGSVGRLASGRFQASCWHRGRRRIADTTFATKGEAHAFLDGIATSLHRSEWVDPTAGRISFAEYATKWLDQRTDLRPSTRDHYRWLLDGRLVPHFGPCPLARIGPADVRDWHAPLGATTPGVARSAYRLLRGNLRHRRRRRADREGPLPDPGRRRRPGPRALDPDGPRGRRPGRRHRPVASGRRPPGRLGHAATGRGPRAAPG